MRRRLPLLVAAALVLCGCLETRAGTAVGPDGAAVSRIRIDLDLAAFDDAFAGDGDDIATDIADQLDAFEERLAEARESCPALADDLEVTTELEPDHLRIDVVARTPDVDALATLYAAVLGRSEADVDAIFGVGCRVRGDGPVDAIGGVGLFGDVVATIDRGTFTFLAAPPAGGDFGGDIEVESDRFASLAPSVRIAIAAPGPVRGTNGTLEGRTVTWTLDGTETQPLTLVSDVDRSHSLPDTVALPDPVRVERSPAVVVGAVLGLGLLALTAVALLGRRRRAAGSRAAS